MKYANQEYFILDNESLNLTKPEKSHRLCTLNLEIIFFITRRKSKIARSSHPMGRNQFLIRSAGIF